ncbi:UxaA family hydrolase [Hoeflea prorocentri]|uniref:UxaA family hydrolase n=1 Tax=Hoeflea prorocentri TaxID=1922333 RepID=A0A9X3UIE6_9HYPH|nr:UxaA family hydrolase [Hoeflea prorocentri]MCY6381963.1 UxaA family hydrolase [Hoeflea prorocentri]MDA5399763.1 UxaA family hydrolase [Hoeflea prorocentri]
MSAFLKLHPKDNVRVALRPVERGDRFETDEGPVTCLCAVGMAHKVAERLIEKGSLVIKYGMPIGTAITDIAAGEHVHVHNIESRYTPTYHHEDQAESSNE